MWEGIYFPNIFICRMFQNWCISGFSKVSPVRDTNVGGNLLPECFYLPNVFICRMFQNWCISGFSKASAVRDIKSIAYGMGDVTWEGIYFPKVFIFRML